MTRLIFLLSFAALLFAGPTSAQERRVALVVGISHYAHAPALAHTLDDAREMAAALKRLHFDVDLVLDPDRAALENAVRRLGQRSSGAEASLFYYSGHGLESQGANWILPASADVMSDRDLRFEALDLSAVLEQIEGIARVSLVFLDACREDPFKQRLTSARDLSRSGLAPVNATVSGTYIAFATAPGMVASDGNGRHSPFTGSLLKYIETPGLEVRQMMSKVVADVEEQNDRQVPWDSSSLKGEFYFIPVGTEKIAKEVDRAIRSDAPQVDLDALFWESIKNSKDAADFNAYLAKFPQGTFAELARNRLAQLHAVPAAGSGPDPKLLAAMAEVRPNVPEKTLAEQVAPYLATQTHKALTAYLPAGSFTWSIGRPTEQEAQDSGLEACEVFAGGPCVLVAVDDSVKQGNGRGLQSYDMPRVHYVGHFDPERIPSVRQAVRDRSDVVGYASAPSPKAAAYHSSGVLVTVTTANDQHAAEEKALADCNDAVARNGQPRTCLLYASGNDVVLPRRSNMPITPAATVAQPNIPGPPATTPTDPKLIAALATALPMMPQKDREDFAARYQASHPHKALAVSPAGRATTTPNRPSAQEAEESNLELCEMVNGTACTPVAVDDDITYTRDSAARIMPRTQYAGEFDPERIPSVLPGVRQRADVTGYRTAATPKAAAYHTFGVSIFSIVTGAASLHDAEQQALSLCNASAASSHLPDSCFLYASNDAVVLPRRSTQPITPAAAATLPPVAKPPATASFHDEFVAQATTALPVYTAATRENLATTYMGSALHKALAIHRENSGSWKAVGLPSAELAKETALEGCQAQYGDPCVTFAVDDTLSGALDGAPIAHDMPRNNYAGTFDPERIPVVAAAMRSRADVQGYAAVPGAKAAAFHPWGSIYISTGAASPNQAEASALAACNGDMSRNGQGGPCYLYAAGNQVVFPRRLQQPLTPVAAVPVRPLINSPPVANSALSAVMLARLTASDVGPGRITRSDVESLIRGYLSTSADHKAFAVGLGNTSGLNTIINRRGQSAAEAQQVALEACQVANGSPCALVALDNAAAAAAPGGKWNFQDMPRVRYEASYDPGYVPAIDYADSSRDDVKNYGKASRPKAMALSSSGKVGIAAGATSQSAAESQALASCGPDCFLYASGNQVVLPKRLRSPRPLGSSLADVISYVRINDSGAEAVSAHDQSKPHKALAILPDTGTTFNVWGAASAEVAEKTALEACSLEHNADCVPIAIDGKLQTNDPTAARRRDLPRLTYQGPYRADMVPLFSVTPKEARDYATMREPKAMAIRPRGPKIVVETGATLAQAEANALAKCNNDPEFAYPCFLYAANGQTVLPQRHTEPQP